MRNSCNEAAHSEYELFLNDGDIKHMCAISIIACKIFNTSIDNINHVLVDSMLNWYDEVNLAMREKNFSHVVECVDVMNAILISNYIINDKK